MINLVWFRFLARFLARKLCRFFVVIHLDVILFLHLVLALALLLDLALVLVRERLDAFWWTKHDGWSRREERGDLWMAKNQHISSPQLLGWKKDRLE